jgi:hypothetical protein
MRPHSRVGNGSEHPSVGITVASWLTLAVGPYCCSIWIISKPRPIGQTFAQQ